MYLIKKIDGEIKLINKTTQSAITDKEALCLRDALFLLGVGTELALRDFDSYSKRHKHLTPLAHVLHSMEWEEHGGSSPGWVTREPFSNFRPDSLEAFNEKIKETNEKMFTPKVMDALNKGAFCTIEKLSGESLMFLLCHLYPLQPGELREV